MTDKEIFDELVLLWSVSFKKFAKLYPTYPLWALAKLVYNDTEVKTRKIINKVAGVEELGHE